MRLIYDQRRDQNFCFLITGALWGGLLAASAVSLAEPTDAMGQPLVPPLSAEVWAPAWLAGGLGGACFLILGIREWASAVRIAEDESGLRSLSSWGRDRWQFRWTDVQSWRLESYQTSLYTTETKLVVELKLSENRLVVTEDWRRAVVVELGANVPAKLNAACTAASSELRAIPDLTLIHSPTHFGFRWEEWPEGLFLHFPPSDLRPKLFWAKLCFLVSVGAAAAYSGLIALGNQFALLGWLGDLAAFLLVVAVVGMFFAVLNRLQYEQERHCALLEFARLTIGLEEVTAEDRAGRRQTWPKTTILAVEAKSRETRSETGGGPIWYGVSLFLVDGSSVSLWSSVTKDGNPPFNETKYTEPKICAAVAWLSSTLRRALGLSVSAE